MTGLRRTLDELCFRYKADIEIGREIYVEGIQDKVILDHLLRRWGLSTPVYTAETIDVPIPVVRGYGLEAPSARSSIIALRRHLLAAGVEVDRHVFLVDRDTEDLVATPGIEGCLLTDHGCLVATALDERLFERLVQLVGRGLIEEQIFWSSVCRISTALYSVRAVARKMAIPLCILPPSGAFIIGSKRVGFDLDVEKYLTACIARSRLDIKVADIFEAVRQCVMDLELTGWDYRRMINDHDFWVIVRTIFRGCGDSVNRSADDIRDLILMGLHEAAFAGSDLERVLRL